MGKRLVKSPFISEGMKVLAKRDILVKTRLEMYITDQVPYEQMLESLISVLVGQREMLMVENKKLRESVYR